MIRSRIVSVSLALALVGGGAGALAVTGSGKPAANAPSASSKQYCPDTSQQPGQKKKPGPQPCGNPQTK